MPRISVLMPIRNAAPFLAQAIRSVLDQSFADFEFLIMDDGSSDDSLAFAREFAAEDGRIRIFARPHRAVATSLNELVALSSGEFIARMDGDDVCRPARFARQLFEGTPFSDLPPEGRGRRLLGADLRRQGRGLAFPALG